MGRLALFSSCVFDCGIKNDLSASVYVLGHLIEPLKIVLQDVEGTEMTLFNILSCCWGQRWIKKENKILYCHHKRKVKRLWRNWLTFDTWSFSNRSFFYFYTYRICRIIVFSLLSKRSLGNRCWTLYFFLPVIKNTKCCARRTCTPLCNCTVVVVKRHFMLHSICNVFWAC